MGKYFLIFLMIHMELYQLRARFLTRNLTLKSKKKKIKDVHVSILRQLTYSHLETYIMEHLLLTYLIKHIGLT